MTSLFAAVFTAQTYPSLSVHRQRYDIRGRRTAVALTTGNTQPLRLHVDFASLYEENAPEYSQCWRQGAWYKRGTPQATAPPASGVPSCRAEGPHDDCWGLCSADDLITPKGREMLIAVVTTIVNEEVSRFFAVRPVVGSLTFKAGRSRYANPCPVSRYTSGAGSLPAHRGDRQDTPPRGDRTGHSTPGHTVCEWRS
jgi:hypothetical protein